MDCNEIKLNDFNIVLLVCICDTELWSYKIILCYCTDVVELKFQIIKVLRLFFNENKILFILVLHKLDLRKVETKSQSQRKQGVSSTHVHTH